MYIHVYTCVRYVYNSVIVSQLAGGHDGEGLLDTVECYDPHSDSWTIVTNLSSPRCLGSLVALKGCLYAVGGYDGACVLLSLQVTYQNSCMHLYMCLSCW